jgi:hypothetical protein
MSAPSILQAAYVNASSKTSTQSVGLTGVTAGATLLLIAGYQPDNGTAGYTSSITGDTSGDSWASANKVSLPTFGGIGEDAFEIEGAKAGAHTISIAYPEQMYAWLALFEITAGATLDQAVGSQASSASTSFTVTTGTLANATELAIAAVAPLDNSYPSNISLSNPPSGWTSLHAWQDENVENAGGLCSRTTSATTALSATWSASHNDSWCGIILTFKPAGGAGDGYAARRAMSGGLGGGMGGGFRG